MEAIGKKELSDAAVQELVEAMYELVDMMPAQGLFTRQLRLFKRNIAHAIKGDQEKFIKNVLEPFHFWMHENEIGMREKKVKTIKEGLEELGALDEAPRN